MKKIFSLSLILLLCLKLSAQVTGLVKSQASVDYSAYSLDAKSQLWQLTGIAHNDEYTGVFFRIDIKNNKEGWFNFPKEIYISGPWGTMYPIAMTVNGKAYELGKPYYYGKMNKGKGADILLYFNRIPAGVSQINYCEPNFIKWDAIPIVDNPDPCEKTNWTDMKLRSYWEENKCLPIEGIYYFTTTNDKSWWGENKHTLAVLKDGYQYKLIYLRGSNPNVWSEGDLKAIFIPTAIKGLYKATSWFMDNKINNEDFYLKFTDGFMTIYEENSNITADFLKLYPAVDENEIPNNTSIKVNPNKIESEDTTSSTSLKGTGSGIFVSNSIIATNYHVVSNNDKIEVVIKDGATISTYLAKILSIDEKNDLALISIEDEKFNGMGILPYSIFSKTREVGTNIFTMGYPMVNYMGEEVKVTDGIISSKTGYNGDIVTYTMTAPIQPGNSGGPMFDKEGFLVGITNAEILSADNVGYAIKTSYLLNLIEASPVTISYTENNQIAGLDITEQIKLLSKYVVCIKVY